MIRLILGVALYGVAARSSRLAPWPSGPGCGQCASQQEPPRNVRSFAAKARSPLRSVRATLYGIAARSSRLTPRPGGLECGRSASQQDPPPGARSFAEKGPLAAALRPRHVIWRCCGFIAFGPSAQRPGMRTVRQPARPTAKRAFPPTLQRHPQVNRARARPRPDQRNRRRCPLPPALCANPHLACHCVGDCAVRAGPAQGRSSVAGSTWGLPLDAWPGGRQRQKKRRLG